MKPSREKVLSLPERSPQPNRVARAASLRIHLAENKQRADDAEQLASIASALAAKHGMSDVFSPTRLIVVGDVIKLL
jgi:phage protein D